MTCGQSTLFISLTHNLAHDPLNVICVGLFKQILQPSEQKTYPTYFVVEFEWSEFSIHRPSVNIFYMNK